MSCHVLVLAEIASQHTGTDAHSCFLAEIWVETALETSMSGRIGKVHHRRSGTDRHACPRGVITIIAVRTVYHTHSRNNIAIKCRIAGTDRHALPSRVVRIAAWWALRDASHRLRIGETVLRAVRYAKGSRVVCESMPFRAVAHALPSSVLPK